ncbi:MAG: primosomal protein N' [Burkholderiaceae bacterium]
MTDTTGAFAQVLLDLPIAPSFDYRVPPALEGVVQPGMLVLVPWGRQRRVAIVASLSASPGIDEAKVKTLLELVPGAPCLPGDWLGFGQFVARYYHRHTGEVLLPAVPKRLRVPPRAPAADGKRGRAPLEPFALARSRFRKLASPLVDKEDGIPAPRGAWRPTGEQQDVLGALNGSVGYQVWLLHGITGSGKTEVYLHWLAGILARDPQAQVLLLVPEIALTPQLAQEVRARLPYPGAILHSGMTETDRAANWLAAVEGSARVIIGTRLAILAPFAKLAAIVVDEEHDPSFKQQESPHYSARDLAIARAHSLDVPVLLGSATPSLESWQAAIAGRYRLLSLTRRATGATLPEVQITTLREHPSDSPIPEGLTELARDQIRDCLARGAQTLVFLNRRGFSPVLSCAHCGWLSQCDDCSAYRVLHRRGAARPAGSRSGYQLVCHHCGSERPVPPQCPSCGELELRPLGQGTQRIEEVLQQAFPGARIGRLDRDVARRAGAAGLLLDDIHEGNIDIIVGTQMLAKGHDIRRLELVVVLDPDGALFASDFRAPERLFATLTQVAGRAGRHQGGAAGRVVVQTRFPRHPIFTALATHDYAGFANKLLDERRDAGLPPFSFHALLRAQAKSLPQAVAFLRQARDLAQDLAVITARANTAAARQELPLLYDPVPMPMARIAGQSRAQLLVESASRPALHRFLAAWLARIEAEPAGIRWQLEIDPGEI